MRRLWKGSTSKAVILGIFLGTLAALLLLLPRPAAAEEAVATVTLSVFGEFVGRGPARIHAPVYTGDTIRVSKYGIVTIRLRGAEQVNLPEGTHEIAYRAGASDRAPAVIIRSVALPGDGSAAAAEASSEIEISLASPSSAGPESGGSPPTGDDGVEHQPGSDQDDSGPSSDGSGPPSENSGSDGDSNGGGSNGGTGPTSRPDDANRQFDPNLQGAGPTGGNPTGREADRHARFRTIETPPGLTVSPPVAASPPAGIAVGAPPIPSPRARLEPPARARPPVSSGHPPAFGQPAFQQPENLRHGTATPPAASSPPIEAAPGAVPGSLAEPAAPATPISPPAMESPGGLRAGGVKPALDAGRLARPDALRGAPTVGNPRGKPLPGAPGAFGVPIRD